MPVDEDKYIKTNEWGGIELSCYKKEWRLISVREGGDGKLYQDWAFPQDKDRKPRDIAVPFSVKIGDKTKAIETLKTLLRILTDTETPEESERPMYNNSVNDDIPF
jgi:hypothetical protein